MAPAEFSEGYTLRAGFGSAISRQTKNRVALLPNPIPLLI